MSLSADTPYQSYPPSLYGGGGGSAPVDPHIDTIAPTTGVAGAAATVQVNGSNFDAGATVELDQAPVTTAFVSASRLTATFTPASAGAKSITVRNANEEESNNVPFTVTAAAEEDPEPEPTRRARKR